MTPKLANRMADWPRHRIAALLAFALITLPAASAQSTAAPDAQALAKYDKNGNGRLDADELAALRADEAKAARAAKPTSSSENGTAKDDIVELSPFQVTSGNDKGYLATNTLSGTRLNSKLEDLGSSISVVTKQQMQDFALLDINDVFLYEANTEGTGNYTDFTVDRNGNVIDNVAGNPNNANRIRGITAANQARGNFGTNGRVPPDPINIDALEISRGPNSSIFGLGNASGTVNLIPATANLQRETSHVELRGDDRGSVRTAIDLNRPILKNKLAVRGSAVWQEDKFKLKPSVARSKRYNGMFTYQPFKNTTIRGATEYYESFARRPNSILPRDAITYWEQVGRPTWDPTTWTVTRGGVKTVVPYNSNQGTETGLLGAGLESGGTGLYARPSLFIEPNGSIPVWIVGRQSGLDTTGVPTPNAQSGNVRFIESSPAPKPGPLAAAYLSLTNKAYYDWSKINMAAPNWSQTRNRTYNLELEHFFFHNERHLIGMQLAWFREESDNYSRTFIGQGSDSPMITYIDVNEKLLDGRVNPYFLRPYINALEPSATRNPDFRDQYRGSLAYTLSMAREAGWKHWIGNHQFLAYGEYKNRIYRNLRYRDAVISNHSWLTPGTNRGNGPAAARGYYRYYLGDATGDNIDSSPPAWRNGNGTYNLTWYNAQLGQWVTEPGTFGEVYANVGNTSNRRNLIKTTGAAMQNHLLDDRVVTTVGRRQDTNLNRDSAGTLVAPDGITADLGSNRTWPNNWFRREGETRQEGLVVKPFRGWKAIDRAAQPDTVLGFFANALRSTYLYVNKSDSFLPETVAQNLVGELLPDPRGRGKDYGIAMNFFGDKVYVKFNKYQTVQVNSRQGDSGTIATRAARIDFSNTTGGSDRFNLYRNVREWVTATQPTLTGSAFDEEVARQMGFPVDQLARLNSYTIADTSDVASRGTEIEIAVNPTRAMRGKINIAQQRTTDSHLSPAIGEYIASRWDLWHKIADPRTGQLWWTTKYGGTSPEDFFVGSVQAPYKLATANEGKPKSQVREWRVNAIGSVDLSAFSDNAVLKRISLSGAVRWEDKASIGYYGDPVDINAYDPNRPIFDKPHTYLDAGLSYSQKLYRDRIRMRVQLNVRNLTEGGRLQPIGSLPDGRIYNFRIIDPRLFILSATFDL